MRFGLFYEHQNPRPWEAERSVDEPLVRELLEQFPELTVESLSHLSEAWDRSAWLVNGALVFGFPRRAL